MKEVGPYDCGTVSVENKKSFAEKTISGILNFFQESLISEGYTKRNGFLQSIDPRVKLVSLLILIVAVSMTRAIELLLIVYLLTLALAVASRIDLFFFIKRVWVFVPVFAGIIVLPIIFNIFAPGDNLVTIATLGNSTYVGPILLPSTIYITTQGTISATTFMLRVATCVSLTVLLVLTTKRFVLFKSLRSLHVPKVYILTLDMCYRYIFLLLDAIRDFFTAKKSRTVATLPLRDEQKWVAGRIGYMLVKSLDTSERVHKAMISRGFNGDVKLMHNYAIQKRDYATIVSFAALSVVLVIISQNIIKI
ncbi:MAG: cobalt ECF transporter T component CbiQ [Halobacteriota archaeon]